MALQPMCRHQLDKASPYPTQPAPATHPSLTAILINPSLFLSVKSFVPGCAARLSAAPPTTIVIALPGPWRMMLVHDFLDTLEMPSERMRSR